MSLKVPSPNIVTLGIRTSTYELAGGGGHSSVHSGEVAWHTESPGHGNLFDLVLSTIDSSCVALDKLLHLFVPQFPHLPTLHVVSL